MREKYLHDYYLQHREHIRDQQHGRYHTPEVHRRTIEYQRAYRAKHRETVRAQAKAQSQRRRYKILEHYGGKCACCGEDTLQFLSIDHIDGGGNEHRRQLSMQGGTDFYSWLVKNNFPVGFQVLCHNCNMAKGFYGKCPHKN